MPDAAPSLAGVTEADLCIVGGGFTGLWAALYAKALDPGRDVVLLEAETAGFGASGRNGGFCVASLTHGIENGLARFPEEMDALERLGLENFDALAADLDTHGIDCDFEPTGELVAFTDDYQLEWLEEGPALLARYGYDVRAVRRGRDARRGRLAHLRRRALGQDRRGDPRPGQARLRAARGGAAARRARVRALGRARPARGGQRPSRR